MQSHNYGPLEPWPTYESTGSFGVDEPVPSQQKQECLAHIEGPYRGPIDLPLGEGSQQIRHDDSHPLCGPSYQSKKLTRMVTHATQITTTRAITPASRPSHIGILCIVFSNLFANAKAARAAGLYPAAFKAGITISPHHSRYFDLSKGGTYRFSLPDSRVSPTGLRLVDDGARLGPFHAVRSGTRRLHTAEALPKKGKSRPFSGRLTMAT